MARKIFAPVAMVALLALMWFAVPAVANHPDDDIFDRDTTGQPAPPLAGWDDEVCDEETSSGMDDRPHWGSLDGQIWECVDDPGLPGVPGTQGERWWQPEPDVPGLADTAYARRWDPVSIPGYPGAYARLGSRTEWVNPYNKSTTWPNNPPQGSCPNVTGGCKFKGGGDIFLVQSNGQPLMLNKTWFNRALQVYVWNATTKVWDKKADTGWMANAAGTSNYSNKMTGTYNYGTAPYGAAWYYVRAWERVWNGSSWATQVYQDPKTSTGALDMVWDDPPGSKVKKPAKPTKAPKAEKVAKKGPLPPSSEPVSPADDTPTGTP